MDSLVWFLSRRLETMTKSRVAGTLYMWWRSRLVMVIMNMTRAATHCGDYVLCSGAGDRLEWNNNMLLFRHTYIHAYIHTYIHTGYS